MDENVFWEYISIIDSYPYEFSYNRDKEECQCRLIKKRLLKNNSFQEVLDFDKIYNQKLDELELPKIIELLLVNYLPIEKLNKESAHISNDGFRDFRGYIIGLGKDDYELVKNFKNENEIFQIDFWVNVAYRSDLEFVYRDLYNEHFSKLNDLTIEEMDKAHSIQNYFLNYDEILNEVDWENLENKYPKMISKTLLKRN